MRKGHKSALFCIFLRKNIQFICVFQKNVVILRNFIVNLFKNLLMKKYLYIVYLLTFMLLTPMRMVAVGWTPTDGGLVLNLEQGDRFLLSVWVDKDEDGVEDDGEEFFVV